MVHLEGHACQESAIVSLVSKVQPAAFPKQKHLPVRKVAMATECVSLIQKSAFVNRGTREFHARLDQDVLFSTVESAVVMAFANMGAVFVDQATRSTMIAGLQMAVLAVEQIILSALGRAFAKLLGTGQRLILASALRVDLELHVNVGRTVAAQAAASMGIATPILESASAIRDGKAGIARRSKSALEL